MNDQILRATKAARAYGQRFITDQQFAELFDKTVATAKKTLERDGYHDHMYLATFQHTATKAIDTVPIVFGDWPPPEGKKKLVLQGLGIKLADENPDATLLTLVHISEAWVAHYANEDIPDGQLRDGVPLPSERPDDRIEVLLISLTSQDTRQSYTNQVIHRKPDGSFSHWGETPALEMLYDPKTYVDITKDGDQLPFMVLSGYVMARHAQRKAAP